MRLLFVCICTILCYISCNHICDEKNTHLRYDDGETALLIRDVLYRHDQDSNSVLLKLLKDNFSAKEWRYYVIRDDSKSKEFIVLNTANVFCYHVLNGKINRYISMNIYEDSFQDIREKKAIDENTKDDEEMVRVAMKAAYLNTYDVKEICNDDIYKKVKYPILKSNLVCFYTNETNDSIEFHFKVKFQQDNDDKVFVPDFCFYERRVWVDKNSKKVVKIKLAGVTEYPLKYKILEDNFLKANYNENDFLKKLVEIDSLELNKFLPDIF